MGKRALQPLAAALKLIDSLSDSEKAVIYDYLRPERKVGKSKSPARPAGGRSSTRSGATSTTASTETPKVGEAAAAAGSSAGGD